MAEVSVQICLGTQGHGDRKIQGEGCVHIQVSFSTLTLPPHHQSLNLNLWQCQAIPLKHSAQQFLVGVPQMTRLKMAW